MVLPEDPRSYLPVLEREVDPFLSTLVADLSLLVEPIRSFEVPARPCDDAFLCTEADLLSEYSDATLESEDVRPFELRYV